MRVSEQHVCPVQAGAAAAWVAASATEKGEEHVACGEDLHRAVVLGHQVVPVLLQHAKRACVQGKGGRARWFSGFT